ncbi:MAG: outer membrane beta-barrel domain-containing protein [Bdellovibrionaceae bacterium]|nr:outer membrane beta-barrel domain-containing protein [Pseudobdellovibrionaceae bacterium]
MKNLFLFLLVGLFSSATGLAAAEVIELPEEELARESVLPVFDIVENVKDRLVVTAGRWELGISAGAALTEPIFGVLRTQGSIFYHPNENHAFGFIYVNNSVSLSAQARQLGEAPTSLDFNRAPKPESIMMADWNAKLFYGKMSLAKNVVSNLSLFTSMGLSQSKYTHKSYIGFFLGLGQKFYFGRNLALRFDLRLNGSPAPIPFLEGRMKTSDPVPTMGEFNERLHWMTSLDVGLSYLF